MLSEQAESPARHKNPWGRLCPRRCGTGAGGGRRPASHEEEGLTRRCRLHREKTKLDPNPAHAQEYKLHVHQGPGCEA